MACRMFSGRSGIELKGDQIVTQSTYRQFLELDEKSTDEEIGRAARPLLASMQHSVKTELQRWQDINSIHQSDDIE